MRGAVTAIFIFFSLFSPALADRAADFEEARRAYLKLAAQNDYEAALPHAIKAYKLGAKLYEPDAELLASLALELGKTYRRLSNHRKAVPVLKKSLATHERIYGPGHSELVEPTVELAETLSLARRFNSAMRKFEDALTLIERAHGKAHPLYADVLLRMGETMLVRLKPRKAELYAMAALELSYSLSPSHEPTIVAAHGQLARIQSEIGNYEKTIHHAREAAHANARARGGTSEPLPLHRPLPTGSKLYDGYVRIELTVADDGSTKKVKILEGQPMNTFDLAVRKAVAKWRFAPAMKNGKFVESKPIVTVINFVKSARCVWLTGAPNSDENGVDVLTKCTWTHDRPEAFGRTSVISNDNNR